MTLAPKSHDALLANVALLYYKEGLTQGDIARRLGVSRPTVVAYLRQAREFGIVDIRIDGLSFATSSLSRELRAAYGLSDVFLIDEPPGPAGTPEEASRQARRQLAQVGAMAVFDLLEPGDSLGVAWGQTIHWLAEEMPRGTIAGLSVYQMIGSMKSRHLPAAETLAIRVASSLNAECFTLHAPAVLSNRDIADALRREPVIAEQLRALRALSKTLFSVGNVADDTQLVQSGIATVDDVRGYVRRGAVGVLSARFIDADGNPVEGDLDGRVIGMELADIRAVGNGILVSSGHDKVAAMRAALVGGYVRYLVTDKSTGEELLDAKQA